MKPPGAATAALLVSASSHLRLASSWTMLLAGEAVATGAANGARTSSLASTEACSSGVFENCCRGSRSSASTRRCFESPFGFSSAERKPQASAPPSRLASAASSAGAWTGSGSLSSNTPKDGASAASRAPAPRLCLTCAGARSSHLLRARASAQLRSRRPYLVISPFGSKRGVLLVPLFVRAQLLPSCRLRLGRNAARSRT